MLIEFGERTTKKHAVVIGAGFGGLACAKKLRRSDAYSVTLIDRNPYQLFSPLLYQVATASLPEDDIAFPVRTAYREVQFVRGEVTNVDATAKKLTLANGKIISYDDLIFAVGSEGTTFGIPGVAEHAFQMKSVSDAREIRRSLLRTYESVEDGLLPLENLNVVIVGGGPTGVELAGAVRELQQEIQREFEHIAPKASVTLLEAGPRLLPSFHPRSSKYTLKTLTKMGVQVEVDAAVVEATSRSLRLKDGREIIAGTRIWAAGVVAPPHWKFLGETDRGNRIKVNSNLQLNDAIWVVGDAASYPDKNGCPLPMIAPVAIQQGKHVARQIRRRESSKPLEVFKYRDKGQMATIGRRKAVVEMRSWLRFQGSLAWLTWLALHLAYLSGGRNRTSIFADWVWNYIVWTPRRTITD
ncbi:MAG: NAD(P)/FAD-dependent oxidoreductase [Ilumatobacteraceae bacterium]|jgi:NADH dehydrogenase|nr:NAD(P)/FAD-dependent oxidoreductase [Ilumatobacteraceae bacterium]